jgi:hypothetical protein
MTGALLDPRSCTLISIACEIAGMSASIGTGTLAVA